MIEIYGIRTKNLPDHHALTRAVRQALYETWRVRHKSVRGEMTLKNSLAALFLLEHCLPNAILRYREDGRPYAEGSGVDFNISHTDNFVFLALDRGGEGRFARVGIDAEDLARISTLRICPMAARWFSPEEYKIFLMEPTDRTFLRIWTRKESLVKWTGDGLRGLHGADTERAEQYGVRFAEYQIDDTLVTLCASAEADTPPQIHMLSASEVSALGIPAVDG